MRSGAVGIGHIESELDHAGDRLHLDEVDGDHPPLARHQLHPLRGDLAPAARRRAEIDHDHAGPQQTMLVVDLGELEGGAAAIAPALRLLDIRIVELALEPAGRGDLPPLGGADPDRELAAAALPFPPPPLVDLTISLITRSAARP